MDDPSRPAVLDAQAAADLALWGITLAPAAIAPAEVFEVAAANEDALRAWLGCETQWRAHLAPDGSWIWTGLDYAAVDMVLRRIAPAAPDTVFADLQLMERAALETWNETRA